ncbi:MAG TPA: hypothetical protein VJJ82_05665 [Candidatus Nanoarchaeia archaeon]|nr:hypothetical protein [Candidatus Nanoarchaeia archaeon]
MMGCKKCSTFGGVLMLLAGILFLLRDLQVWNFWGISWWTVLFILWGAGSLGASSCADCQAMSNGKKK